ncbi:unnamed protein product [Rhizopus stolonifer]
MRRLIYPDAEAFINFKKEEKYAKLQQETSGSNIDTRPTGKRGKNALPKKKRYSRREKKEKSVTKRNRIVASSSTSTLICKSCGTGGHSSTRSKLCPNHNFTLQELIEQDIGNKYERYMISLRLKPFLNETDDNDQLEKAVDKIKSLSDFLRIVMFKAQVFINYYIIKYPQNLPKEFFQQNFWYLLCRVVCEQLSVSAFQSKYTNVYYLEDLWTELNSLENINLIVAKDGLRNYGQVLATNIICRVIPDVKRSIIKDLVYEHVLDQVLSSNPVKAIADNILTSLSQEIKDTIQAFISPLIVELKNRLPSFSITKASLNTDPFGILPALKHILSKYESLIAENPNYS